MSCEVLEEVFQIIEDRKTNPKKESYVCSLFNKGEDKILEKVGEEAVEFILASKSNKRDDIIYEAADLIFHLLVALSNKDVTLEDICKELRRRRR